MPRRSLFVAFLSLLVASLWVSGCGNGRHHNNNLTVTTSSLPNGTVGTPYPDTNLGATGGTAPYTWAETSGGAPPPGLTFSDTGEISGTPTTAGTFGPYVFTVTDNNGQTADSGNLTITIANTAEAACAPNPTARGNEAALTAPFAILLAGSFGESADPVSWVGSFKPNGSGGVTGGTLDFVSFENVLTLQVQSSMSSYSYGSDGRGCLYLTFAAQPAVTTGQLPIADNINTKPGTNRNHKKAARHPAGVSGVRTNVTFSFVLGQSNKSGRIEEFDLGTSAVAAAGSIHVQTPGDFSLNNLANRFAFGAGGWFTDTDVLDRAAIAGTTTNSNGTLMNSFADTNIDGNPSGELSGGSGTLSAVASGTGRGTGSYTIPDNGSTLTFNFVYYVIDKNDFFFITNDDPATLGAVQLTGRAVALGTTPPTPNGFYMFGANGFDPQADSVAAVGTAQLTNQSAVPTATIYTNDSGTVTTKTFTNGSYALETASGRLTLSGIGSQPPVSYLTAGSASEGDGIVAFLVATDISAASGFLVLQSTTTPSFNPNSINGGFALGSAEDIDGFQGSLVAQFILSGGNYTAIADEVVVGNGTAADQTFTGVYAVNSDGSGNFDQSSELFVTNGTSFFAIDGDGVSAPFLYVAFKQ